MTYLTHKINTLLDKKFVRCDSEDEVIDIVQYLRRNDFEDMENLDFDLNSFKIWLV